MTITQLHRIRRGARAALTLGVVVSILANILHANGNPISQAIAAWAPVALLLTIELIARVPIRRGWLSFARLLATATIAGIAAWVSYWHMVGVALRYGEEPGAAHLIPLTVDGLVVVAWVCLVEVGGRIRQEQEARAVAQGEIPDRAPLPAAGWALHEPTAAPPAPVEAPASGAPAADEGAGQKVRQDTRSAQQVEALVRAMRAAEPKLSQRKIAEAAMVPPTTVRRILRPDPDAEVAQKINGREPELVTAGASEKEI